MAKSARGRSAGDAIIKSSAQRFDIPRRALKKAVQEATVRLVAERIAGERLDSSWQELVEQARQEHTKARPESKASRAAS